MTEHWIWLSRLRGLGPVNVRRLLEQFGGAEELYAASDETLAREGVSQRARTALARKDLNSAHGIAARCAALGLTVLTLDDPTYPARLRELNDAPIVLYCRGTLPPADRPWIGVVGAREATERGSSEAYRFGWQLSGCGAVTVSGLARGVDAAAARGTLDHGGQTVAVLGCGVDLAYPAENRALYETIGERGCLISEYPPGSLPYAKHFPVRNRIISGLCDGILVIEAGERSGALITARWAGEQGRDVFALPGDVNDPHCLGCNRLIREGGILAACGWDVVSEYEYRYPTTVREYHGRPDGTPPAPLPKPEPKAPPKAAAPDLSGVPDELRPIAEALRDGPLQLDALIDRTGLPAAKVTGGLTVLEIRGFVCRRDGKRFSLKS